MPLVGGGLAAGDAAEGDAGEVLHVVRAVDAEGFELVADVVEEVRLGGLREDGLFVVVLERREDVVGLVGEVEDHGFLLLGVGAVEAREGLDGMDAGELLVDVHGVEKRLVEAGLELFGDHQEAALRPVESGGGLALGDVSLRFCSVHFLPSSSTTSEKATSDL